MGDEWITTYDIRRLDKLIDKDDNKSRICVESILNIYWINTGTVDWSICVVIDVKK